MRRAAAVVFVAALLASSSASAQDTGSAAAATQLFDEGVAAMEKGRFAEACPKLAKSAELAPNGGTLLALADCYEKNGQFASAWLAYKDVSDRAAAAHKADVEKNALDAAKRLEPKISRLTVTAPAIDGLVVKRDGKPVNPAEIGVPVPLDPGQHVIDASAPGRKPWSARVAFGNTASQKTLAVPNLEPDGSAQAPVDATQPPPATGSNGKTQRIVGIAVGGVGVVGLALGTVFGLQAKSKNDDASSACPDPSRCSQSGIDLDKKARDAATISTIGFIAGGALLVGGAVLFFTAPASPEPAASVGVRATPGGAAMTFGATF
jgi:hypothetical protein